MDPEQLQTLWSQVNAALEAGATERQVNSRLRRLQGVPVNSLRVLRTEAEAAGLLGQETQEEEESDNPLAALTPAISGGFGELADEVVSGLEQVGLAREGAAERFRGDVEETTEEHPVAATASRVGGLLASPATRAGARAIGGAANLAGRGTGAVARGAARAAGGTPLSQIASREAGRSVGATLGGGAAGAAEGAAFDLATREGSPGERVAQGPGFGTLLGAAGGAATSAIGSGVHSARRVSQAQKEAGEQAAEAAERFGQGLPTRRGVAQRVDEAQEARRAAFGQAEAAGKEIPGEVTDMLASENPIIRRAVRNAANQGSPEARRFLEGLRKFEAGEVESLPAASFELADDVRKQLNFQGGAFERNRSLLSPLDDAPSAGAVKEAQRLGSRVEETLEEVPGFRTALEESAAAGTQARGFAAGERASGQGADVVEDVLQGKKVQVGGGQGQPLSIPDTPAAQQAFRAGVLRPEVQRLRSGSEPARNWLNTLETSSELQRKVKAALGGDEAFDQFMKEAEELRAVGNLEGIAELLVKSAGFFTFGSSLLGGVGSELLFN